VDSVDASFFTGDIAGDENDRPIIEGMVLRWMRRLIARNIWVYDDSEEELTAEQEAAKDAAREVRDKEASRQTARRMIALILEKCQELDIEL
jgi:hypothetical protein